MNLNQSSDVAPVLAGVIGDDLADQKAVRGKRACMRKDDGKICEYLQGSGRVFENVFVIERKREPNVDRHSAIGDRPISLLRRDRVRVVSR